MDQYSEQSKIFANKILDAANANDIDKVKDTIQEIRNDLDKENPLSKAWLYYFIGYGLSLTTTSQNGIQREIFEINRETIENYREALYVLECDCERTELSNSLNHRLRIIYGYSLYRNKRIVEALYNLNISRNYYDTPNLEFQYANILLMYCNLLPDTFATEKRYLYSEAYNALKWIKDNFSDNNEVCIITESKELLSLMKEDITIETIGTINEWYNTNNDAEDEYYKWCRINSLYLNPASDSFFKLRCFCNDNLPNDCLAKDNSDNNKILCNIYDDIKYKYCYLRRKLYLLVSEKHDGNHLESLNYINGRVVYSELCYDLYLYLVDLYNTFDKIAYFVAKYFRVSIDDGRAYFDNVMKRLFLDNYEYAIENSGLCGLYSIMEDIYLQPCNGDRLTHLNKIKRFRNYHTHRCVVTLVDNSLKNSDNIPIAEVTIDEVVSYIPELLRSVREAIMYLSISINIENKRVST